MSLCFESFSSVASPSGGKKTAESQQSQGGSGARRCQLFRGKRRHPGKEGGGGNQIVSPVASSDTHTPPLASLSSAANSAEAAATDAEAAMAVEERTVPLPLSLFPRAAEGEGEEEEEVEGEEDASAENSAASLLSSSAISVRMTLFSLPCVANRCSLCTTSPPGAEREHLLELSTSHGCDSAAAAVSLLEGSRSSRPRSRSRASSGRDSADGEGEGASRPTSWCRIAPQTSWREAPETESQKGKEPFF